MSADQRFNDNKNGSHQVRLGSPRSYQRAVQKNRLVRDRHITSSSCNSPCPLVADGCGRGAVDFALTAVAWSVATDHATAVSTRGGERRGYGFIVIRKWSYRAYTRSRLTPQSVPVADLPTLGPVIVCGVRFRGSVTASCERTGYTQEKSSGYKRLRSHVNST